MHSIFSILPKGEGFSPEHAGAIALCVRDFTLHSRYREGTHVIGGVAGKGFPGTRFTALPRAPWYRNRTRTYAQGCLTLLRQESATLAEIHNRPILLRHMAGKADCRFALHLHNDPREMDCARTPSEREALLATCSGVYCVSRYVERCFLEGMKPEARAKLHVVPNGIALPSALPPKENLIVFAGRMTENKGALPLAQALALALPALPGWRAAFIGSRHHAPGETPTAYEKQVEAALAPVRDRIEITGFLPHEAAFSYFLRGAIAVVPSVWNEPFGRTALEALAAGCALISSGRGGLTEVTGDAALELCELTPHAISDAITGLARDEARCRELQSRGRKRAEAFDIATCTAILDAARDSILAKGASHAA